MTKGELLVRRAQREIQEMINTERKEEHEKRIDYYNDIQADHLEKLLQDQFRNWGELGLQKNFRNIVKRVINKVSLLYNTAPNRALINPSGKVNKTATKRITEEVWNPAELNLVMATAERFMNLNRTVAVKVSWRDKICYDLYTPDFLDVVQNEGDITIADAVIYERKTRAESNTGKEKIEHIVWSAEDHFKMIEQGTTGTRFLGKPEPVGDNTDMINPYKIIPFAWWHYDYRYRTFWCEGGNDLITAQDNLNVQLTELNQLIKMQSFSVPVMIGFQGKEPTTIDPTAPICFELGTDRADFKFVTPDPRINELWKVITEGVNAIATDYDIAPGSFQLTGSVRSGLELKLENVGLIERAFRKKPFAIKFENDLWDITRIVYEAKTGKKLPDLDLAIDYDELQIPEDPEKEIKVWEQYFRWGLKSPIDWIKAQNPNLTDKQAEELYKSNLEYIKQLKEDFPSLASLFEKKEKGVSGD